jgi:hypothetical protein
MHIKLVSLRSESKGPCFLCILLNLQKRERRRRKERERERES